MEIFTTALRNKQVSEILHKNTSPYSHSASLVIRLLTMLKRTHFSELSISRFTTYTRKAQGLTGRPQIQRRIQAHFGATSEYPATHLHFIE